MIIVDQLKWTEIATKTNKRSNDYDNIIISF